MGDHFLYVLKGKPRLAYKCRKYANIFICML